MGRVAWGRSAHLALIQLLHLDKGDITIGGADCNQRAYLVDAVCSG
jgi:hypothetical protein